jgi:D-beta-D-heptose 7-phosphate kinase/D-beta-D-heptose 1-phosphate adenosyltransferase
MLVVIGDALLDRDLDGSAERLAPDAPVPVVSGIAEHPRPGGAGLAAALAEGPVGLICALGSDPAGVTLCRLLADAGVEVFDLGLEGATPEKIRVRAGGRPLVRLDSGGETGGCGPLTRAARTALAGADAVLVADYGRGIAAREDVRAALCDLRVPVVWDPHPRGPEPIPGATLVTPNEREAAARTHGVSAEVAGTEDHARTLLAHWRAVAVAVTRGARGAVLVSGDGPPQAIPAPYAAIGDPCGAGDCFSVTAAQRLAAGALPSEAVRTAVEAATAFVAGGGAGGAAARGFRVPERPEGSARELAERARAAGRTVVATGGCFDLLHAGHVGALRAARALGDCLIVCLNSDASVRRIKGPDRPLVPEQDRAAVLAGLECVDAVAIFDEDDPREILRALRPHVWAKGGDYAGAQLPEAPVLAEWGGHAVTVPYLSGRSTTGIIDMARSR